MRSTTLIAEILLTASALVLVNASSLGESLLHGRWDAALVESMSSGEDELRYLAKIREAAEGRWLMANPYLQEYRESGFSPSGFVEWIPAVLLRALHWNFGLMLLLTDLLFTFLTIILTRAWLGKLMKQRWIAWTCLFVLLFTSMGGALDGLLRDVAPKFIQPLASLYILLLALPTRATLRRTLERGLLIGVMYYTYPYHWSLFLLTEGVLFLSIVLPHLLRITSIKDLVRFCWPRLAAAILPLVIIALPLIIAMRRMLSRPEFLDFYDRYHIVYTRIPAAPRLQLVIVIALLVLALGAWVTIRKQRMDRREVANTLIPLALPLVAMLLLLYANVVTGKDPELLGHGGRVILPVVTVAYATVIALLLPKYCATRISVIALGMVMVLSALRATGDWRAAHRTYNAWAASPERQVLKWLDGGVENEQIIAAPRALSEKIPVLTSHSVTFAAGAHFFFVPLDELVHRYLGWVALYPWEQEPTDTATVIIFGNHPGAQWSKERTVARLLGRPFIKTMADYIPRQDLRRLIDAEHAASEPTHRATHLEQYGADIVITRDETPQKELLTNYVRKRHIGPYDVWERRKSGI